jgi:drug/metabolite transporter (DMT)-like permease
MADLAESPPSGLTLNPPRGSEVVAAGMLVAACLCWATFFPLGKNWLIAAQECPGGDLVGSLTLMGVRSMLALLAFALFKPRQFLAPTRREVLVGLLLGTLNCVGNILQTLGLASTTPALSGFFTSLASLWVPLFAWLGFRLPISGATWTGIALGAVGLGVLGIDPAKSWGLGLGDSLTILSSLVFGLFIVLLDRLGRTVESANLALLLIVMTGIPPLFIAMGVASTGPGVVAWADWLLSMLRQPAVLRDVLAMTLLSTVLATHLMSKYQPRVAASRAALIYLLEPVFASTLSVLMGHDDITLRLLQGGALILAGNAVAELPVLLREFRKPKPVG